MPKTSTASDRAADASARGRVARWAPVGAWMCVIFGFSSLPGSNIPGGYSFQGHLGEYAVLGVLVMAALRHRPVRLTWALAAIAACSLYGASDELHQALVPGRTPDVLDWATDTFGAAVGVALAGAWLAWRPRAHARDGAED